MFDSHPAILGGARHRLATRTGGVAGNARLTGAAAVALLVLLAAEGVTIPFIGKWLGPHIFIGLMLLPPVALKLGSTGYRFARYYTHDEPYVRKGPPSNTLIFAHKLSFIAWVALMSIHVLSHLLELPSLASADWRRHGPRETRLAGAGPRATLVAGAITLGAALGAVVLTAGTSWH